MDAKSEKSKAEQAIKGQGAAEEQAQRRDEENKKLQDQIAEQEKRRDTIKRFAEDYGKHLNTIRIDLSKYKEERSADRKDKARQRLENDITAFVDFIGKWRAVHQAQGNLLDGNIEKIYTLSVARDVDGIDNTLELLQKEFQDLVKILLDDAAKLAYEGK